MRRNSGAKPGDALILTKGLGVGIYSSAFKKKALPRACYEEMIASTTLLNRIGSELAADPHVHALTDVTGFGILGHGLEMARASGLTVSLSLANIPFLSQAETLSEKASSPARRSATGRVIAARSNCPMVWRTGSVFCSPTRKHQADFCGLRCRQR